MKAKVYRILVEDQEKALQFYTEKLGFLIQVDILLSEGNRCLTVESSEQPDRTEVLIEPALHHSEPEMMYKKALFDAGIPFIQLNSDNVQQEYEKLVSLGVEFSVKPTEMEGIKIAIFNDTCGINIQIVETL